MSLSAEGAFVKPCRYVSPLSTPRRLVKSILPSPVQSPDQNTFRRNVWSTVSIDQINFLTASKLMAPNGICFFVDRKEEQCVLLSSTVGNFHPTSSWMRPEGAMPAESTIQSGTRIGCFDVSIGRATCEVHFFNEQTNCWLEEGRRRVPSLVTLDRYLVAYQG